MPESTPWEGRVRLTLPALEPGQCGSCGLRRWPLVDGLCLLCRSCVVVCAIWRDIVPHSKLGLLAVHASKPKIRCQNGALIFRCPSRFAAGWEHDIGDDGLNFFSPVVPMNPAAESR